MTIDPAPAASSSSDAPSTVSQRVLEGPHGPLDVRVYLPNARRGAGIVWVHGGGFASGDLDMPESDWVARQFAEHGIVVVCVEYRLAPIPNEWAARSGSSGRSGVHYPVASDEVEYAFRWASESGLATGEWALGGASAGGNLAAGASLRLVHNERTRPALVALSYPTLHSVQPAPDAALRAALDRNPDADRFGPDAVRAMYENYLGASLSGADIFAVPGTASADDLEGFPPVIMINADVDELRVSGEAFADTLREAGVDVELHTEIGSQHGFLNIPEDPAAAAAIERFAARIVDTMRDSTGVRRERG
ncbi:acetyl esterase [Microbacterium natoriense]|uniref:Acetyl esterase n=1 Tax=Microbacterium natoriense TaxID=284570 RepID=A0AAW8EV09_9MICO|nr:alpha/beta hydrolase fold domain-containing protein [Microbacterium natoriense]MDQ0647048.1 acetyl esterase [Microbacterium natoriense]